MKKILALLGQILLLSAISYATPTTITMQGDVNIVDDPTTTSDTEGNLNINGNIIANLPNFAESYGIEGLDGIRLNQNFYDTPCFLFLSPIAGLIFGNNYSISSPYGKSLVMGNNNMACSGGFFFGNSNTGYCDNFFFGSYNLVDGNNYDGYNSFLVGSNNTAGNDSVVIGNNCNVNGGITLGWNLININGAFITLGKWNDTSGYSESSNLLLVLGNGTGTTNKSNALVIYNNGNADFTETVSAKKVKVSEPAGDVSMGVFGFIESAEE